ncbi:hypothetical protein M514_06170 [Trichuris suis]|uniref:Uncharacterized protein n=1 Tax=Trichuris suis TaxID=68888 RepID=A0A085M6L4_9BILA|nr:hypothetical protein M513_06170 [Trichuris suis]KFD68197.1 hypothetical protein M514_06170 [Trichuris suis]
MGPWKNVREPRGPWEIKGPVMGGSSRMKEAMRFQQFRQEKDGGEKARRPRKMGPTKGSSCPEKVVKYYVRPISSSSRAKRLS